MSKDIIIGGGGFALEMSNLLFENEEKIYGYIALNKNDYFSIQYLGNDIFFEDNNAINHKYFLCIGDIKTRKDFYNKHENLNYNSFLSSRSFVVNSKIGTSTFIYPNCTIFSSVIGNFSLINSNVSFSHEVQIGNFCNIGPGCNIGGKVNIADNVYIGIGSSIRDNVNIGSNVVIGAHSNVTKNIEENSIVYGNPARKISKNK